MEELIELRRLPFEICKDTEESAEELLRLTFTWFHLWSPYPNNVKKINTDIVINNNSPK